MPINFDASDVSKKLKKKLTPEILLNAAQAGATEIQASLTDLLAENAREGEDRFVSLPGGLTIAGEGHKIGLPVPDGEVLDTMDQQGQTVQDLSDRDLLRARASIDNSPGSVSTMKLVEAEIIARGLQAQVGVTEPEQATDNNRGSFEGKRFWSGSASALDGVIEEVHPYEEAAQADFHHTMYFSQEQLTKLDSEENMFFWLDKDSGKVNTQWRNKEAPYEIQKKIQKQIKFYPKVNGSVATVEMTIPVGAKEYGNSQNEADAKFRKAIEGATPKAIAAMKRGISKSE